MKVHSIKTHAVLSGSSILEIVDQYVPLIPNKTVLAITSKIVSLCQNRILPKNTSVDKKKLIEQEADFYLEGDYSKKYGICLTLKNNILIPTAGIDESNGNDCYILYPKNVQEEAVKIWEYLRQKTHHKEIGVLITDSHTSPLRRGVTGIALAWCGFHPLYSYIGQPDIFGCPLKVTQINVIDSLAVCAVFSMGEGNEQTPLALLEEIDKIHFVERPPSKAELDSVTISLEEDLYAPLLTSVDWKKSV